MLAFTTKPSSMMTGTNSLPNSCSCFPEPEAALAISCAVCRNMLLSLRLQL